jgi:uncharacterized RDD family membrane protein YckC
LAGFAAILRNIILHLQHIDKTIMKSVEITTAQNVSIVYTVAPVSERGLAYLLDLLFCGIASLLLHFILSVLFPAYQSIISIIAYIPFFFLYHLFMEVFTDGQSFGKRIMKIKVLKLTGEKPGFFDSLVRWVFRLPDILFSSGLFAVLMASSTSAGQRLGDFLADTVVIKVLDANRPDLKQLLEMNARNKSYDPSYPQAKQLTESDVLLIKETIDRFYAIRNASTQEAVVLLARKIEDMLNIKGPKNRIEFLQSIIKDYVFLTR